MYTCTHAIQRCSNYTPGKFHRVVGCVFVCNATKMTLKTFHATRQRKI